jgi:uncharacterized membrane protein YhaH (DUF805 family)
MDQLPPKPKNQGYLQRAFSGRLNRQNFCVGSLLILLVPFLCLLVLLINGLVFPTDIDLTTLNPYDMSTFQQPTTTSLTQLFVTPLNIVLAIAFVLSMLLSFPYLIALQIRRLHDLNQTGWLTLLCFVPLVSYGIGIYVSLWPGTDGENKYGPKPLSRTNFIEDILRLR